MQQVKRFTGTKSKIISEFDQNSIIFIEVLLRKRTNRSTLTQPNSIRQLNSTAERILAAFVLVALAIFESGDYFEALLASSMAV